MTFLPFPMYVIMLLECFYSGSNYAITQNRLRVDGEGWIGRGIWLGKGGRGKGG